MCCCVRVIHMAAKFAAGVYQAVPMADQLTAVIFAVAARFTPQPTKMAGSLRADRTVP